MNKFNFIKSKITNGMFCGFAFGYCVGLLPNKIFINFNNKKYNNVPLPLISGCIGSIVFLISPLLIANYFFDGVYFDKFIDKYNFDIKRYHQYDGYNNKYAFPSLLIVSINHISKSNIH